MADQNWQYWDGTSAVPTTGSGDQIWTSGYMQVLGSRWSFCPKCGKSLQADWNHCPGCGTGIGMLPVQGLCPTITWGQTGTGTITGVSNPSPLQDPGGSRS